MNQTPGTLPDQQNDLSSAWMEELKTLLGRKGSKKKLPLLAGQMKAVSELVVNVLPKELDLGDSHSGHVDDFQKTYNQVHKILNDLKNSHDLGAFAEEYQAIVAAAREAKEDLSPALLNSVLADLQEFAKKLEGYKKEYLSQHKKHEEGVARVSKEAGKGKQGEEAALAKLNAEYDYYVRSISGNLEKLKQLSADDAEGFLRELVLLGQSVQDDRTVTSLGVAVPKIADLDNRVLQRTTYAQVTKDAWKKTCEEVQGKIEGARSCLPLAVIKRFNERFAQIDETATNDNQYLKAAVAMRQLRLDVESNATESKRWQAIYKQLSDLCSVQVKQVDKVASPSLSDQMRSEFFEARQFGMLYDFQPASERLANLAPRMARLLEETNLAAQNWETDKQQLREQLEERLNEQKLEPHDPLRLKILADAEMFFWMGDKQRAYQQAKQGLDGLLHDSFDELRSRGDVNAENLQKNKEAAAPFIKSCELTRQRLDELSKALQPSDTDGPPHLDTFSKEFSSIRDSIYDSNDALLQEPALGKALTLADKLLADFNKRLDGLLGDTDDAKANLQSLQQQEAAWRVYEPLWKNWSEARKFAEGYLDAFARVGGDQYLEFRKTFELADQAAEKAAANFQNYLKMFPLSEKTRDKAAQLFEQVQQALRDSYATLGGDFDTSGNDDNYRSKLVTAAVQAQNQLDESLKTVRKKLKEAVSEVSKLAESGNWKILPSFCQPYRERGKQETKEAAAFEKSTCPGAIETAIRTVELIIREFIAMLDNVGEYQRVGQIYHELEKLLDNSDLKKCCPTKRAALKKQFKEEVKVDLGKVKFDLAERQLATFKKQSLDPALSAAEQIAKSREAGKQLAAQIEKLIKELVEKHQFPKGDCGAYSDLLARRVEALQKTEDEQVAKEAVFSLTRLFESLTKDSAQDGFADKVKGQIQTREKNQEERDQRVKAFEEKLDTFLKDEYELAKRSPQATKSALKSIKQTAKTARKLAREGEFATADEQLNTIKQLAAELIGAPEIKPIDNPKKFVENWSKTMGEVRSQLEKLRGEIDSAVREHFGPQTDGQAEIDKFQKTFAPLMDRLVEEFAAEGERTKTMSAALTTLGSVKATLSDMKRERERALAVLRHYKTLLGKNPLLKQLNKHPFDSKVAVLGLNKMLNEIEFQVVVTT